MVSSPSRENSNAVPRYRKPAIAFVVLVIAFLVSQLFWAPKNSKTKSTSPMYRPSSDPCSVPEARLSLLSDLDANTDCLGLAMKIEEPYTLDFQNQRIDLNGPMYAFYRWKSKIEKSHIDLQKNTTSTECRIIFKILDRELFVYEGNACYETVTADNHTAVKERYNLLIEHLLIALQVFDVPDMDFVMLLEDHPANRTEREGKSPSLSYCVDLLSEDVEDVGFTYPSYGAYQFALGPCQASFFRECLKTKYPSSERISKAVWRGSSTGIVNLNTKADVYSCPRVVLSNLSRWESLLDVGISDYVQMNDSNPEVLATLQELAPLHSRIPFEDFNNYAAVIDIIGNTWSDRLSRLLTSNTPILKMRMFNWWEYFAHFITDDHVQFFKEDLTDVAARAADYVRMYHDDRQKWESLIANSNRFADEHLSQLGVVRAMAYALSAYANFSTWTAEPEEHYKHVSRNICCKFNSALPTELVAKMQTS